MDTEVSYHENEANMQDRFEIERHVTRTGIAQPAAEKIAQLISQMLQHGYDAGEAESQGYAVTFRSHPDGRLELSKH